MSTKSSIQYLTKDDLEKIMKDVDKKELISNGITIDFLRSKDFTAPELIDKGFTLSDLTKDEIEIILNNVDKKELISNEKNFKILSKHFTALELKKKGFTLSELKECGFELFFLAFTYKLSDLRNVGFTLREFKKVGFKLSELKKAGFTAKELKYEKYKLKSLKNAGFTAKELYEAGFSIEELEKVGFKNMYFLRLRDTIGKTFKKKSLSNNTSRRNKQNIHLDTNNENDSFRSAVGSIPSDSAPFRGLGPSQTV